MLLTIIVVLFNGRSEGCCLRSWKLSKCSVDCRGCYNRSFVLFESSVGYVEKKSVAKSYFNVM